MCVCSCRRSSHSYLVTDVVGKVDTTDNTASETNDGSKNSENNAKNVKFKIADIITGIY